MSASQIPRQNSDTWPNLGKDSAVQQLVCTILSRKRSMPPAELTEEIIRGAGWHHMYRGKRCITPFSMRYLLRSVVEAGLIRIIYGPPNRYELTIKGIELATQSVAEPETSQVLVNAGSDSVVAGMVLPHALPIPDSVCPVSGDEDADWQAVFRVLNRFVWRGHLSGRPFEVRFLGVTLYGF